MVHLPSTPYGVRALELTENFIDSLPYLADKPRSVEMHPLDYELLPAEYRKGATLQTQFGDFPVEITIWENPTDVDIGLRVFLNLWVPDPDGGHLSRSPITELL